MTVALDLCQPTRSTNRAEATTGLLCQEKIAKTGEQLNVNQGKGHVSTPVVANIFPYLVATLIGLLLDVLSMTKFYLGYTLCIPGAYSSRTSLRGYRGRVVDVPRLRANPVNSGARV